MYVRSPVYPAGEADDPHAHIDPLELPIAADRQGARRHYGVHPYFTRRPFNVVRRYVQHYSREGDIVADPFGGSGVTAIEAYLENRVGVQNDINPLANFIACGIAGLHRGCVSDYRLALEQIRGWTEQKVERIWHANGEHLERLSRGIELPPNIPLPRSSDVPCYHDLFSHRQLLCMSILRSAVERIHDIPAREAMRLAWSATLTKVNRTFLSTEGRAASRGGSSIFSIYRYKIAKEPVELHPWHTFSERAGNIIAAKREVDRAIELKKRSGIWRGMFICHSEDVEDLAERYSGLVDYLFTDPPYGAHISYLDLGTLWNSWLGILPGTSVRSKEVIVGGDLELSDEHYMRRLRSSIDSCVRMLKPGRWMSVVFQHWNVAYFEAILAAAEQGGAPLRTAVSQAGDPIWSMHKKKNSESVLSGEMILTFHKSRNRISPSEPRPFDVAGTVAELLASSGNGTVMPERLFNDLIIRAWDSRAIGSLNISREAFAAMLRDNGWRYDAEHHRWARAVRAAPTLFDSGMIELDA